MLAVVLHPGFGFFWLPLFFFVVLMGLALWAGRRRPPAPPPRQPGLRVLEERYARGEIDRSEFLSRRKDLIAEGEST